MYKKGEAVHSLWKARIGYRSIKLVCGAGKTATWVDSRLASLLCGAKLYCISGCSCSNDASALGYSEETQAVLVMMQQ